MSRTMVIPSSDVNALSYLKRQDIIWILSLFGTAIGAGTLFLPINVGIGGFWPMIIMAMLAFPMTFYAHRGLTRFVLSGSSQQGDIIEVVHEHFGKNAGHFITLLYFSAIYPILLVYSVAVTNTVQSFIEHQLHLIPPPRFILSAVLIFILMLITRCGKSFIVKVMSFFVIPFLLALVGFSIYLIPNWNGAILSSACHVDITFGHFMKTVWLAIPVMVFSFNHSPIISSFAVEQKKIYGGIADKKSIRILTISHCLMILTVFFFVASCIFSLSQNDLMAAKEQNISILSYLANHFNNPMITYVAPLIAFVAITKSFLGHYLGASEGLNGLILKSLKTNGRKINEKTMDLFTTLMIGISAWLVATFNPSILAMIETLGGPVIAMILFIMPMYAIYKVPALRKYANKSSNLFVIIIGCIAISAIFYMLLQ